MTEALLLMDIQNGIVDHFAADEDYLDRVVAAQVKAEAAATPVILVRVGFREGYPEVVSNNLVFGAIKSSGGMRLGGNDSQLHHRLLRGNGEIVVTKKRISAFAGSDLGQILRALFVDHLVVGGIATSGVVLSTVREAADLDHRITVLSDLCLDMDEEVHRVLTTKVFPMQATVIESREWLCR